MQIGVYTEEYSYQASEQDSKTDCKSKALLALRQIALEKAGVCVVSQTEVKNFSFIRDRIGVMAAGMMKSEILGDQFDGKTYTLKARLTVTTDPEEAKQSCNRLIQSWAGEGSLEGLAAFSKSPALPVHARLEKAIESYLSDSVIRERRDDLVGSTFVDMEYDESVVKLSRSSSYSGKGVVSQEELRKVGVFAIGQHYFVDAYAVDWSLIDTPQSVQKAFDKAKIDRDEMTKLLMGALDDAYSMSHLKEIKNSLSGKTEAVTKELGGSGGPKMWR